MSQTLDNWPSKKELDQYYKINNEQDARDRKFAFKGLDYIIKHKKYDTFEVMFNFIYAKGYNTTRNAFRSAIWYYVEEGKIKLNSNWLIEAPDLTK
jgi:hypothetical protein